MKTEKIYLYEDRKDVSLTTYVLVVEDTDAGIEAAVAGGMHPVGIGEAAANEKAEYKINSFADLLAIAE